MISTAAPRAADYHPGDPYDWKQRRIHRIADERDAYRRQLRWHRAIIAALISVAAGALFIGPVYLDGGPLFSIALAVAIFAGPVTLAFATGVAWEEARDRTREDHNAG